MAQLDRMQRHGDNPKTSPRGLTVEQVLRGGESSRWSPTSSSPTFWKDHDPEEDYSHHHKKSVLAKVKEKAKKIRRSLSKKKHSEDGNTTPSWGVSLDDDEDDEDAEYLGAPMYESELAPEGYKETARQHPRAVHVVSEKHVLACSVNLGAEQEKEKPTSPNKTMTETVTDHKLSSPLDATHEIASKFQCLTVSAPTASQAASGDQAAPQPLSCRWPAPQTYSTPATPQTYSAPAAPHSGNASFGEQIWDKGVSVKEYLIHKIEPGEDERALSQVISETMSPRRIPGDIGVVEKVREAVTSLLRSDSSKYNTPTANSATNSTSHTQISANARLAAKNSPSHLPISTNAHEVGDEENHGRILQAN